MTHPSRVGVLIATYHDPPRYSDREFVREAVASVRAQTHGQPIEVVVVDGASPERIDCVEVEQIVGADHCHQLDSNCGVCLTLNWGIDYRLVGEWVIPMNADDQLAPHFVESALDAAGQWERDHTPSQCGVVVVSQQPLSAAIERDNYIPYLAMFARWFWVAMGGFQDVLGESGACRLADWDLWIRIWQRYGERAPVAYIHDPSVIRLRDRPDSASKWSSTEFERLRAELWRRRGIE